MAVPTVHTATDGRTIKLMEATDMRRRCVIVTALCADKHTKDIKYASHWFIEDSKN
jgi:hypothetical protein